MLDYDFISGVFSNQTETRRTTAEYAGEMTQDITSRAGAVPRKIMGTRDWLIIVAVVVVVAVITLYFLKVF